MLCLVAASAWGAIDRHTLNNGQLVLENIPPIPADLPERLGRYQRLTASQALAWTKDGDGLYVRRQHGGVGQIHRIDRRGAPPRPLTRLDEPMREVARQPGGRLLAFTVNQGGDGADQIMLLDPADGTLRALTDSAGSLNNRIVWDRQGRRIAFRSTRRNGASNDLWILPVDRPADARLVYAAPDGALWKPVAFSRDGKRLIVQQYSGITDSRIHVLELESGVLRELVGDPDRASSNVAVGFDENDAGVFFVSNLRGRSAEIGWVPLDPLAAIRWVEDTVCWDVTRFTLSEDGRRGAFVTNEHGVSRLYLFNARRFSIRRLENTPIGVIGNLRFSPNGRRLAFTASTPTSPGDVYEVRLRFGSFAGRLRSWTASGVEGLDRDELVQPALFFYPAPGPEPDTTFYVPGFRYLPEGPGPHPVVIYIHGGPESQFRPGFNSTVQLWAAELGVAVLAPNVRGSLGYGRTYLSLDDGRRREDAVHDIGALLDWIRDQPELDANRVAVYGASYGGYMALATAVHYSDRLVGAVTRAGISNFVTYLENTSDFRRDLRRFEYGDERDPSMRAFLESISPLNNVERIDVPLLVAQGRNDPVVPASESEQIVRALRERGQTVWYLNALNEGHNYEKQANRDVYQQVTYLFLERYLLGR